MRKYDFDFFAGPSHTARRLYAEREYQRLKEEGHDIILPPSELPVEIPKHYEAAMAMNSAGNWANTWLMQGMVEKVKQQAKGKVNIAIIDTAYQAINQYIKPFWLEQYSTEHTGESGADGNGHGHLCAGNIFADHPTLMMGVIRELAKAGLVRFTFHRGLRANGSGSYADITRAIDAAASVKVPGFTRTILSMSFGGPSPYNPMRDVLQQARAAGVFCCAAAGNEGDSTPDTMGYPGKYAEVMAWGALEENGNRAYYSSIGSGLFGMAPGSNILSTTNTPDGLAYWNGTSGAEPHAVAVMACISLMYPEIDTQDELEAFAVEFMEDLQKQGHDIYTGHGAPRLSAYFDRTPEDEPGEPENPGNDPEPEPEKPQERNERAVVFDFSDFSGEWKMYWRTVSEQRLKVLTLTNFRISTTTTAYTHDMAEKIRNSLSTFFHNRGLVIPNGQDYQDAANWSQYFYDMIQTKDHGLELEILEVSARNEQALPVTIPEKQIKAWNRRINRLSAIPAETFYFNPNLT